MRIQLNIGCGENILPGYVNLDRDSIEEIKKRYPQRRFPEDTHIYNYNVFDLPYEDGSVDLVKADSFLEHLSFIEESKFFFEIQRILKVGGVFEFSVPDFEKVVTMWLKASDEWKDFYRNDEEAIRINHWFGQYTYTTDSRWGYLTAIIFGNQNGEGQMHKNCYTVGKICAILKKLHFKAREISYFLWDGDKDPMIKVVAVRQ